LSYSLYQVAEKNKKKLGPLSKRSLTADLYFNQTTPVKDRLLNGSHLFQQLGIT